MQPSRGMRRRSATLVALYSNGDGVKQDDKEAVAWYRKAAVQGFVDAQDNLGCMYGNGTCVAQDTAEAVKWLQLAAEQGDEDALKSLNVLQQHTAFPVPPPILAGKHTVLTSDKEQYVRSIQHTHQRASCFLFSVSGAFENLFILK